MASAGSAAIRATRRIAMSRSAPGILAAPRPSLIGVALTLSTHAAVTRVMASAPAPKITVYVQRRGLITDPTPSTMNNTAVTTAQDSMDMSEEDRKRLIEKARKAEKFEEWLKEQSKHSQGQGGRSGRDWSGTAFKMFESAATTFASIFILGMVGWSYNRYYKSLVLQKMENAFAPGDPVLELAAKSRKAPGANGGDHWIPRPEQELIDKIIAGELTGHYHLLVGEKGTGKTSMILEAMAKIDGDGCSVLEAHPDSEIFRIRLGKALDFEFHEDNIGSLFSIRGPRESNALADVERAFNKLEKVAKRRQETHGKPAVIIINGVHLLNDNEESKNMLTLIQHKAEALAAANLVTFVFNSDEYWVYERLKSHAARMKVTSISDLDKPSAMEAFRRYRKARWQEEISDDMCTQVYDKVGGRLAFLNRVAESKDMIEECDEIIKTEKSWFLSQCGILGEEMDDDVMDQQKFASTAMVLAQKLVAMEKEMEQTYDPDKGHILPQLPLHMARYVMTRADFMEPHDRANVFTVDAKGNVRADSVPMMNAFRQVCSEDGFDEFLDATLERISAIESLNRTKEIELKDLLRGKKYQFIQSVNENREAVTTMEVVYPKEDGDDTDN